MVRSGRGNAGFMIGMGWRSKTLKKIKPVGSLAFLGFVVLDDLLAPTANQQISTFSDDQNNDDDDNKEKRKSMICPRLFFHLDDK